MCALSINSFVASWLLFCLINPFCNGAEKPDWISYEANDPSYHQFQPLQSEAASEERAIIPELAEKPYYKVYHHDYHQPTAVHSRISSKNVYPVRPNVAKSVPEFQMEKKPYYGFLGHHVENQRVLKKESDLQLPQHRERARRRNEEITKKMNALEKFLSEDNDENHVESMNTIEDRSMETSIPEETKRVVRQVRRQRPGFFWTLARLAFETFNDTRSAIQQISNILNENFEPDTSTRAPVTSNSFVVTGATTSSDDQSNMSSNVAGINVTTTTTTQAPFRFTRTGFQNLIRRNLRGLMRLLNLEWQDALNQSEVNAREFQKDLGNQVGSFLQDNPNAF